MSTIVVFIVFIVIICFIAICMLAYNKAQNKNDKTNRISIKWLLGFVFFAVFIAWIVLECKLSIANDKYEDALNAFKDKKYGTAEDLFYELGDYRDSEYLYLYCEALINMKHCQLHQISGMVEKYFDLIPEDYDGLYCEEIKKDREYIYSEAFHKDVEERIEKEKAAEEERERYWQEERKKRLEQTTVTPSYKNTYTYIYQEYGYFPYYTDPDDYDTPEDFADDAWGLDFEDWDEAYEYWENF